MLFNSNIFILVFLPAVLLLFYGLPRASLTQRMLILLGGSVVFYAFHTPVYVILLAALIVANYWAGERLRREKSAGFLAVAIAVNLGVLGYFKYANFFIENVSLLTGWSAGTLRIVLPLGISFFTFQKIAYLVDSYRGNIEKGTFLEFALFVMFFPQLIAGPIVHYNDVVPQFRQLDRRSKEIAVNIAVGATIFAIGLFKKIVIADELALYADQLFDAADAGRSFTFVEAWVGVLSYTFQIYFDFSAYSDMAIGLARMVGVRLPLNFNSPYQATSIVDFWRRWHITLSRFLRAYLYLPLGGNRHGAVRRYGNLMAVMLLGGLWHGASWNFVLWGGLHGLYLCINHGWRALVPPRGAGSRAGRLLCWFVTFAAVTLAWVPFRADNFQSTMAVFQALAGLKGMVLPEALLPYFGPSGSLIALSNVDFNHRHYLVLVQAFGLLGDVPILPLAALVALCLPNVYAWMGRFEPYLDYREADVPPVRWLAWRPAPVFAVAVAALAIFAVVRQGTPYTFLYFQF